MHAPSFGAVGALLLFALGCREDAASPVEPALNPETVAVVSDSWITRAGMPRWRLGHATATVTNTAGQSVLYVIGGVTIRNGLHPPTNQAYNLATNRWTTVAPQPRRYYQGNGAGVIQRRIYIAGGFSPNNEGGSALSALYMYDPDGDTWVAKRSMPSRGMHGVSGVIGDRFYVLTGCPCASTPKFPQVMDRQSPAPTGDQFGRPSWPRGASRLGLSRAPSSRSR